MSNNRKKKKSASKKKSSSFNVFSYDRSYNVSPQVQIHYNIFQKAQQLNSTELDPFLKKTFANPLCPQKLNCIYQTNKEIFNNYIFTFKNFDCELIWFKNLFIRNSYLLNNFLNHKEKIDLALLSNDINTAFNLLSFIEQNITKSLWGIEIYSHLKKEFLNEDTSEFLSQIKREANNSTMDFYIQQLILKSESKEIATFIVSLDEVLHEMRNTKDSPYINDFADLASSYLIPYEFDQKRNIKERSLKHATCYSLIDQYLLFREYIKDKIVYGEGLTRKEYSIILELLHNIKDQELTNLINVQILNLKDINTAYLEIIKEYTKENYTITQDKIIKLFQYDPLSMVFIEIMARCHIYLNQSINHPYLFINKIVQSFIDILLSSEKTLQSIEYLERISSKFKFSCWNLPILFHKNRLIDEKKHHFYLSLKTMRVLGNKITPYCIEEFNYNELLQVLNIKIEELSNYKKLKFIPTKFSTTSELNDYLAELEINKKITIDYLIEKSHLLLSNNQINACLEFIVKAYFENNMNYIVLPIREVLDKIEEKGILFREIELPIICDIYSKKIDYFKNDFYMDTFQDFMDLYGEYRPSDIFSNKKRLSIQEIYFLRNICIIENLDVYPEYACTENLKRERIKILDILIKLDMANSEIYKKEKTKLFDELIFEKLKTDFDSSKIYVDVESLRNKREDEYRRLFSLLLMAKVSENPEEEYIQLDEGEDLWIPVTDLSSIISKIYSTLFNDFVSNPDFGLDKYLSADIRHGVFIPHIRSSIEGCNLLTEENNGIYEDNSFWLDKYPFLVKEFRSQLNDALKEFSKEFDEVLDEANNWFKINIYVEDVKHIPLNDGIFDFTMSKERLSLLQEQLNQELDFENFFNIIISFMWSITEDATVEAKNRLNTILKPKLLATVDKLETKINEIRDTVPLKELLGSITSAKSCIHSDLEKILNWFNCVQDNNNNEEYSLSSILNACTDTFKNIASETSISLNFIDIDTNYLLFLTYRETRALMSSLFTALINSNNYKSGTDINIYIKVKEYNNQFIISIENMIKLDPDTDKKAFLLKLKEKFSDEFCTLSTSEGGTGLYKIYNFLTTVSKRFTFDIDINNNNYFIVEIGVNK